MDKKIAKLISIFFEPYTVASATVFLIFLKVEEDLKTEFTWLVIAFLVGVLPPLAVLVYEKQKGKIHDWFMSNRAERRDVQLAWVGGSALFTALAMVNELPRALQALSLSFFTLSLLVTLVSFSWKISVHVSIVTLALVSLILIYSESFVLFLFVIPLVAWARIRLGAHTLSQVTAAALLTVGLTYFWFNIFGLATF